MVGKGLHEVGEDDVVLECVGDEDQIQRILIDGYLLGEQSGIVAA